MNRRVREIRGACGAAAMLLVAATGWAQDRSRESTALQQQQREVDEKLKHQRHDLAPLDSAFDFQWGGLEGAASECRH